MNFFTDAEQRPLRLRPLNQPRPISVECHGPRPVALLLSSGRVAIQEVAGQWRVEEGWWDIPITRWYFRLVLEDGRVLTVFWDRLTGDWYAQRYAMATGMERRAS